jgi:hypothetical protein
MGDSQSRRVRGSSVKDLCARQRGIRIDLEGDGDQRQYKNADKGSHGPACRGRIRQNQSNKPAKNGSFIAGAGMLFKIQFNGVGGLRTYIGFTRFPGFW